MRARFRCSLAGESREPCLPFVPGGEIKMGPGRYERFQKCPWGIVLTPEVSTWLRTHYVAKEYPAAVPASAWRDPRMLAAFAAIDGEQAAASADAMKEK